MFHSVLILLHENIKSVYKLRKIDVIKDISVLQYVHGFYICNCHPTPWSGSLNDIIIEILVQFCMT